MRKKIKWKKKVVTGLLFAVLAAGTVVLQGDHSVVKAVGETGETLQVTEDGAWEYEYVDGPEGETGVTITKYTGEASDPIIPAEINGYPVTELAKTSFNRNTGLTEVEFPDSLVRIDGAAFYGCTGLETAVIPNSVEDIKFDAFYYCTDLTIYAEEEATGFYYAKNEGINYVTVNCALYPIHKNEEGWLYTKYWDNNELEIVGYQGGETDVEIPRQIDDYQTKWIAGRIFMETGIENITFPEGVEKIGEQACEGCYALKSVTLPETLCYLGDRAFWQCTALTGVTIPASVTYIGMDAFYQCENLSDVDFEMRSSEEELELGIHAFYECDLKSIELPAGVKSLGEAVFYNNESLEKVTLPEGVESIGSYCFYGCLSLESVNLPSMVTYIWDAAFMGCQNITEITVPASVTTIEKYAKERDIPYVLLGEPSEGTESPEPSEAPKPSETPEAPESGNTQPPAGITTAPGQGTQTQPSAAANGQTSGGAAQTQDDTKKTEVSSVAAVKSFKATAGKRVIAMHWKKVSGASGYQIQISTKKNFAGAKTIKVKKTKKNLNKLKKETIYYLRIRAYAVNGADKKAIYGKWATVHVRTR